VVLAVRASFTAPLAVVMADLSLLVDARPVALAGRADSIALCALQTLPPSVSTAAWTGNVIRLSIVRSRVTASKSDRDGNNFHSTIAGEQVAATTGVPARIARLLR